MVSRGWYASIVSSRRGREEDERGVERIKETESWKLKGAKWYLQGEGVKKKKKLQGRAGSDAKEKLSIKVEEGR